MLFVIYRHMMWYGAQHTHILDDRDVDEYYKNPKFEEFVHLKQTTAKIIVYSTAVFRIRIHLNPDPDPVF